MLKINLNLGGKIREVEATEATLGGGRPVLKVNVNGDEITLRDRSALHDYMKYDILAGNPDPRF